MNFGIFEDVLPFKKIALVAVIILTLLDSTSEGLFGEERAFNPSGASDANPYQLPTAINSFAPNDYISSRWGVWESQEERYEVPVFDGTSSTPSRIDVRYRLGYSRLNSRPTQESILISNLSAPTASSFANVKDVRSERSNRISYQYPLSTPVKNYSLLRPLHFRFLSDPATSPLIDLSDKGIGSLDSSKIVVLIHGWQADESLDDPYGTKEWNALETGLKNYQRIKGDWRFLKYKWNSDSSTGPNIRFSTERKVFGASFLNGTEAAEIGVQHGVHLGDLIIRDQPDIERIHFIVHSAGTWVARGAIEHLRNTVATYFRRRPLEVSVTFLDPFVPGEAGAGNSFGVSSSTLTRQRIQELNDYTNSGNLPFRIHRLENFYSDGDATDYFFGATSVDFEWPTYNSLNLAVDSLIGAGILDHSFPIDWYSRTFDYSEDNTLGWRDSMFMQEPYFQRHPKSSASALPQGGSLALGASAFTRHSFQATTSVSLSYRWYRNGIRLENDARISGAGSKDLTITNLQPGDGGRYFCRATNGQLSTDSGIAEVLVAGGRTTPEIDNVTPSPLLPFPAPQIQEITISGSGFLPDTGTLRFTSPSGEVFTSLEARFTERTAGSIRYNIAVDSESGEWTVVAINGNLESNPFTFLVGDSDGIPRGSLQSLTISGPTHISEGNRGDYSAVASYSNGTAKSISPAWSISSGSAAIINNSGQLTASAVNGQSLVVLKAGFSDGSITKEAFYSVSILDNTGNTGGTEMIGDQLLRNGGFEQGTVGWNLSGTEVSRGAFPFEGLRYAVMGETHNAVDTLSQTFTVPANSDEVELSLRLNITSSDGSSSANDTFAAFIEDPGNGSTLEVLRSFSNRDRHNGPGKNYYQNFRFDLTEYRSDEIRLKFVALTDSSQSTSFRLDNVSVTAKTERTRPRTLNNFVIEGPSVVDENSLANFAAYAVRSDGSKTAVSADWSDDSSKASINDSGRFRAFSVRSDTKVTIEAEFRENGRTRRDRKSVTVRDKNPTAYYTLNISAINGEVQQSPSRSSFADGVKVFLTVKPDPGYQFTGWSGDLSGNGQHRLLTMEGNITAVANFQPLPPDTGSVRADLRPEAASQSGAKWRLDGGDWFPGGTTLSSIPVGVHTVEYADADGWSTPSPVTFTIFEGQAAGLTGLYSVNGDELIVESISPISGPIEGGNRVTIKGVNFDEFIEVDFGGIPATEVELVDSSTLTVITPEGAGYGTVSVEVSGTNGSEIRSNGYTYRASQGNNMELVGAIGGTTYGLDVSGSLAFLGEGSTLKVIDVSNKSAPSDTGQISLPGQIYDVCVSGDYAFVACGEAGLQIVDISDPEFPSLKSMYDTPGRAFCLGKTVDYLLVGDYDTGLFVLEVSNPERPVDVAFIPLDGDPKDLHIVSHNASGKLLALVAARNGGLHILDISDPTTPSHVSTVSGVGSAEGVSSDGRYAFIGSEASSGGNGLHVIDIQNFSSPSPLVNDPPNSLSSIALVGDTVLGLSHKDLVPIDVSNPANPDRESPLPDLTGSGRRIHCQGGYAYITVSSGGLDIFSISNPNRPTLRGNYSARVGQVKDVEVVDGRAFIAAGTNGLQVVNVEDPSQPFVEGSASEGNSLGSISVSGGYAHFINLYGELETYRISTPSNPTHTSIQYGTFGSDVLSSDSRVYMLGFDDNEPYGPIIDIFGRSNPGQPNRIGSRNFPSGYGNPDTGTLVDGKVYAGHGFGGRWSITDVSDASNPVEIASGVSGSTTCAHATGNGDYLFLAERGNGIAVLDVSDPGNVAEVSRVSDESLDAEFVFYRNNYLYVAGGFSGGLRVYDITDPADPQLNGFFSTPNRAVKLKVVGDLVYLADSFSGLMIIRHFDSRKPSVEILSPSDAGTFEAADPLLTLAGSADDDVDLAKITWSNSRGGGGVASGAESWKIEGIQLEDGANIITVTAFDLAGNFSSDQIIVNFDDQRSDLVEVDIIEFTLGEDSEAQLFASNDPTRFEILELPEGLEIDPLTGRIFGTPTDDGSQEVIVLITNSSGTKAHRFTLEIASPIPLDDWRPDLSIGTRASRLKGNNIYASASRQTVKNKGRAGKKLIFYLQQQNDGQTPDTLRTRATKGNRYFKAKYYQLSGGKRNITGAITRNQLLGSYHGGQSILYRVELKSKRIKRGKKNKTFTVRGVSLGNLSLSDVVRFKAQVKARK